MATSEPLKHWEDWSHPKTCQDAVNYMLAMRQYQSVDADNVVIDRDKIMSKFFKNKTDLSTYDSYFREHKQKLIRLIQTGEVDGVFDPNANIDDKISKLAKTVREFQIGKTTYTLQSASRKKMGQHQFFVPKSNTDPTDPSVQDLAGYTYLMREVPGALQWKNLVRLMNLKGFRRIFQEKRGLMETHMDVSNCFGIYVSVVGACIQCYVKGGGKKNPDIRSYLEAFDGIIHMMYDAPNILKNSPEMTTYQNNQSVRNKWINTSTAKIQSKRNEPDYNGSVAFNAIRGASELPNMDPYKKPACRECGLPVNDGSYQVDIGHFHSHSKVWNAFYVQAVRLLNDIEIKENIQNNIIWPYVKMHLACFAYMMGSKVSNVVDDFDFEHQDCNKIHGSADVRNFIDMPDILEKVTQQQLMSIQMTYPDEYSMNNSTPSNPTPSRQNLAENKLNLRQRHRRRQTDITNGQWTELQTGIIRDSNYLSANYRCFNEKPFEPTIKIPLRCDRCFAKLHGPDKGKKLATQKQWTYRVKTQYLEIVKNKNTKNHENIYNWHCQLWLCTGCYERPQNVNEKLIESNIQVEQPLDEFIKSNIATNVQNQNLGQGIKVTQNTAVFVNEKMLIQLKVAMMYLIALLKPKRSPNAQKSTIYDDIRYIHTFLTKMQEISKDAVFRSLFPENNVKVSDFVRDCAGHILYRLCNKYDIYDKNTFQKYEQITPSQIYSYAIDPIKNLRQSEYQPFRTYLVGIVKNVFGNNYSMPNGLTPISVSHNTIGKEIEMLENGVKKQRKRAKIAEDGEVQQTIKTAHLQYRGYLKELKLINKALELLIAKNQKLNTLEFNKHIARLGVLMAKPDKTISNTAKSTVNKYKLGNKVKPQFSASVTSNEEDSAESPSISRSKSEESQKSASNNMGSSQLSNTTPEVNVDKNRESLNGYLKQIEALKNGNNETKEQLRATLFEMKGRYESYIDLKYNKGIKRNLDVMLTRKRHGKTKKLQKRAEEVLKKARERISPITVLNTNSMV